MDETSQSYTDPPLTAADITWTLEPGPYPSPTDVAYDDPHERITDLTLECNAFRVLSQQLLHALEHVMRERDRLRDQVRSQAARLRDAA